MSKPSWDSAPKWANWLGIDDDGEATWYEHEPELFVGHSSFYRTHRKGDRMQTVVAGYTEFGEVTPSLERRP